MVLITLEVPEWAEERHIYVFAGREVIARKLVDKPLEVKTVRCNLCGECCRNCSDDWMFGQTNGVCNHLRYERTPNGDGWFCKLRGDIVPFTCCKGKYEDLEKCCIRFEEV